MNPKTNLLEKAISIAVTAHRGQVDKTDRPYILHPLRGKVSDSLSAGSDTYVVKCGPRGASQSEAVRSSVDLSRMSMSTQNEIEFAPTGGDQARVTDTPEIAHQFSPEFVALSGRGGDPICGLSRSWWYAAETAGRIRLVRLRKPGNARGRVLLPVRTAIALVHSFGKE